MRGYYMLNIFKIIKFFCILVGFKSEVCVKCEMKEN